MFLFDAIWYQIVLRFERPMLITLKFWKWSSIKNVSFVILLLQCCLIFGQQKVIVLDPGHGGKDSGAIGENGIKEKEVVLDIANEISRLNRTLLNDKFDIYQTRYKDTLISLADRAKLGITLKADLFVSLHCNHSDNPEAVGIEVYIRNSESQYSRESAWFAYLLQAGFIEQLGFKSRGVKFANFQVLRETVDLYTSVLLELGFLSNREENDYYNKSSGIRAVALIIIECLIKI